MDVDDFLGAYRALGECILPLFGVFIGICAASPAVRQWFRNKEASLKASTCISRTLGLLLIVFCVGYIIAVLRVQHVQSVQQSSVYQARMIVKQDAITLADQLDEFTDTIPNNNQVFGKYEIFVRDFDDRIHDIRLSLANAHQRSDVLDNRTNVRYEVINMSNTDARERIANVSKEIRKLANQIMD